MNKLRKILCLSLGHSHILKGCFGYMSCARCGEQVGDALGGGYTNDRAVIVGHKCPMCRKNYNKLGWRDRWLTPYPF